MLSPQQGSSTASSRVTTRLRGHTRTRITMTNPTVSTARDMSAWPAQNCSSQLTNFLEHRQEEAGDALRSCKSSQAKHVHYRPQLRLGEGLLLLPDWNPSGSQAMRSRLSNPRVGKEGRWETRTVVAQSQADTNIYRRESHRGVSAPISRQDREGATSGRPLVGKAVLVTLLWTTMSWCLSTVKLCNS